MRFELMTLLMIAVIGQSRSMDGQASPAAIRSLSPTVGVTYSRFAPDYGQGQIQGLAIFANINTGKHLGLEGVARRVDIITPYNIGERAYLIGPIYRPAVGRFSPYIKLMGGLGVFRFQLSGEYPSPSTEHFGIVAYGAGLDVSLSSHVLVRVGDFEAQRWPHFPPHGLTPYGVSTGLAYAF